MRDRSLVFPALVALGICVLTLQMPASFRRSDPLGTRGETLRYVSTTWRKSRSGTASTLPRRCPETWQRLEEAATDDIVRLQQGAEADIGKQAVIAANERQRAASPGFRVLRYVPEIKEVMLTEDGWAFEWGTFAASFVQAPGGEERRIRGNLLRIFRKQADGRWKVARAMWNTF